MHLSLPLARDPDRDDGGLADHTAVDAHFVVRRVEPHVSMLGGVRSARWADSFDTIAVIGEEVAPTFDPWK